MYYIHIDIQDVQDDDELERELEALLAPQRGRAPWTTKILLVTDTCRLCSFYSHTIILFNSPVVNNYAN